MKKPIYYYVIIRLLIGKTVCNLLFLKQRGDMALMINPGAILASVVYLGGLCSVMSLSVLYFKSSYLLNGFGV